MNSKKKAGEIRFLDFKVKNESWNSYDLSDGTRLRVKFVLISILREPASEGFNLGFTSKIIVGALPPIDLMRKPSATYTPEELEASVIKEDLDFEVVEQHWNRYELEEGIKLKIMNVLVNVRKTSKYDSKGIPIYIVNTHAILKPTVPKKKRKSA